MYNVGHIVKKVDRLQKTVELLLDPVDIEPAKTPGNLFLEIWPENVAHEAEVGVAIPANVKMVQECCDVLCPGMVGVEPCDVQHKVQFLHKLIVGVCAYFDGNVSRVSEHCISLIISKFRAAKPGRGCTYRRSFASHTVEVSPQPSFVQMRSVVDADLS